MERDARRDSRSGTSRSGTSGGGLKKKERHAHAEELRALESALTFAQTRVEILEATLGAQDQQQQNRDKQLQRDGEHQAGLWQSSHLGKSRFTNDAGEAEAEEEEEDARVEEDVRRIVQYAKERGQAHVVDRYGAAEIERFLLSFKYQRLAQDAACKVQAWWRMCIKRVKFLRVQRRRRQIRARFFHGWVFYIKAERVLRRSVRRRFLYRWRFAKDECVAARKLIMQMTQGHNDVLMSKLLVRMQRHKMSIARTSVVEAAPAERPTSAESGAEASSPTNATQLFVDPKQRRAALERERQRKMWARVRQMAERNQKRQAVLGWKLFLRFKALRRIHASMHLLRMTRLSERRRDAKLWVGERRKIIFEMWRRWSVFRRSRRMNEPTPVFAQDFPLWDEWLEGFARLTRLKAQAARRAPRMMLLRFFRKLSSYRRRRQRKRDNEALAKQQYEESRQYYVLKHWFNYARKRGSLLRQTRRILVAWYEWAKRKARLRVVKRFLALNMRSDTKRVVLRKWKQRYEDVESLRMIQNDKILCTGSARNVQIALHAVFAWQRDVAHVYLVRAWWAWRRVSEGRRRWAYARFVYLRAEAYRVQRAAFSAWATWFRHRRGRQVELAEARPHDFQTAQHLNKCIEAGSALPSQWTVEDAADLSVLQSWMTRTSSPPRAPWRDTPLHEAVDVGDVETVRALLASFESPERSRKLHVIEKHKLRMFKQVRKARKLPAPDLQGTTRSINLASGTSAGVGAPSTSEPEMDVKAELKALDAFADYVVDTQNTQGSTCLHLAARHVGDERFKIVVLLVRAGASVFAKDAHGRTPADLASDPRTRAFLELHAARLEAGEFTPLELLSYRRIRTQSSWAHLNSAGFWRVVISASCSSDAAMLGRGVSRSSTFASGVLLAMGGAASQAALRKEQQRTIQARQIAMQRSLERDRVILARGVVRQQLAEAEAENAQAASEMHAKPGSKKGKRRSRQSKPSAYFLHYLKTTEIPHKGIINELAFRKPSQRRYGDGLTPKRRGVDEGVPRSSGTVGDAGISSIYQRVLGPKPSCEWALRSGVANRRGGASTMRSFTANLSPCESILQAFDQSYGGPPGDREHDAASQLEASLVTKTDEASPPQLDKEAFGRLSAAWKLAVEVRQDFLERLGAACSYMNARKYEYAQRAVDAEAKIKRMESTARSCRRSRRLTAQELNAGHERIQNELAELEGEMKVTAGKNTRLQDRIGQLLKDLAALKGRGQGNSARARALKKELAQQQELAQQVQTQIDSEERRKSQLVSETNDTFNQTMRRLRDLETRQSEAKSVALFLKESVSRDKEKAQQFKQFEEELKSVWIGARAKLDEARFKQARPAATFERSDSSRGDILLDYEVVKSSALASRMHGNSLEQAAIGKETEAPHSSTSEDISAPVVVAAAASDEVIAAEDHQVSARSGSALQTQNDSGEGVETASVKGAVTVSSGDGATVTSAVRGTLASLHEDAVADDGDGDDEEIEAHSAIHDDEDDDMDEDDEDGESGEGQSVDGLDACEEDEVAESSSESSDNEDSEGSESDASERTARRPRGMQGLDSAEDSPKSWNDATTRAFSAKDVGPRPSRDDVLMVQAHSKQATPLDQDPILQLADPLTEDHPAGRKLVKQVESDEAARTRDFARKSSVVVVRDDDRTINRAQSMRRLGDLFSQSRKLLFHGEVVDEEVKISKVLEKERKEREKELADRRKFEEEAREHRARALAEGLAPPPGALGEVTRGERISFILNRRRSSIDRRVKELTPREPPPGEDDDEDALLWEDATRMNQFPELERPDYFFANFVASAAKSAEVESDVGADRVDDEERSTDHADEDDDTASSDPEASDGDEESPRRSAELANVRPHALEPFASALWKSQDHSVSTSRQRALEKAQGMSFEREKLDPYLKMVHRNEDMEWKPVPETDLAEPQSAVAEEDKAVEDLVHQQNSTMGKLTSVSFIRPVSPTVSPVSRASPTSPSPIPELAEDEIAAAAAAVATEEDTVLVSLATLSSDTIEEVAETVLGARATLDMPPPADAEDNYDAEILCSTSAAPGFFAQVDLLLQTGPTAPGSPEESLDLRARQDQAEVPKAAASKRVKGRSTEALRPVSQAEAARILREERAALRTAQEERRSSCGGLKRVQSAMLGRTPSQACLRELASKRQRAAGRDQEGLNNEGDDDTAIEVRSEQMTILRTSKSAVSYRPRPIAEALDEHVERDRRPLAKRCASAVSLDSTALAGVLQAHAVRDAGPSEAKNLPPRHDFATARRQGVQRARRARLEPLRRNNAEPGTPSLLFVGRGTPHAQAL